MYDVVHLRAARVAALAILLAAAGGCSLAAPKPVRDVPGGDPERGRAAIQAYGCGACHYVPGVPGANGEVGPPLAGIATRAIIGGHLGNDPDNMVRWIQNPPAYAPGTAMPALGVTENDARDIAAYLYTLR